ncbi:MAG TPA: PhzF family phenazine biosynthesis isomerase [Steroidobacteraceae bacterium]|nr:PhzF family phenazine biosynthesis isomerase [Steroidobacteraceae bacterium]
MRIFQVDAFTSSRFSGNPASVVLDADGLDEPELLGIAREFAHAEVAFVLPASAADHDLGLRFFNARKEAPFVGHATVAAHAVLLALGRRGLGVCRQRSGTGIIEVTAYRDAPADAAPADAAAADEPPPKIEFRQSAPELDPPLPLKTTLRVAEALGLPGARLHETLPARLARKGSTRLLVPVADAQALGELAPRLDALCAIGREIGAEGFFAFSYASDAQAASTDSRMFCPALGIPEDPVSGNGHAMLAAYLFDAGLLAGEHPAFSGRQGAQMSRPGQVDVRLEIDRGRLLAVRIGGRAVIVSEGHLCV